MLFIHIIIHFTPFFFNNFTGKNAHVPPKLSTTGQKTPLNFCIGQFTLSIIHNYQINTSVSLVLKKLIE